MSFSALNDCVQSIGEGFATAANSFTVTFSANTCTSGTDTGTAGCNGGYWMSCNTTAYFDIQYCTASGTTAGAEIGDIYTDYSNIQFRPGNTRTIEWEDIQPREPPRAERVIEVHEYIKSFQRSKKLLKEWLTDEEFDIYKRYKRIVIQSQMHQYREYHILSHSAEELTEVFEEGEFSYSICIHDTERSLPKIDRLLSKILMLKSNESEYERIGNRRTARAILPLGQERRPIPILHPRHTD